MSFIIASLKQEHAQGLWEAVDSVAREKKFLAFLQAPPFASTVEFIDAKLKNNIPSFVAIVDGKVVGWCDLRTIPRPIFSHVMEVGIGVMAPFRRRGIGMALMELAIKTVQEQGYTRLELSVRASNSAAIQLYKKLGFELEGVKRRQARIDGVYEDVLWMARLFETSSLT